MSALQVVPARPRGNARLYVSAKAGRAGEVAARFYCIDAAAGAFYL